MKTILLLSAFTFLLATTGCLVSDGGGRYEHVRYERRNAVIVGPPVLVVHPPEIIVR